MASKRKRLSFFDSLMLFLAVLAAIAMVMGAAAGNYDPRTHIFMAFIGLAYPFVLFINLLFIAWWLIRKKWLFAVCTIGLLLTGYTTFTATFKFFGNTGENTKAPGTLRLMTYNVHSFKKYGEANDVTTKNKIMEVIKEQQPDVVCFQEFYTRFKGEFDITDSLKVLLKTPYYYFYPSSKNSYEGTGLAIFSKFPIKNPTYVAFEPASGNASIYVDILFDAKPLRIYNIHLRSISFDKQDYKYLDKVKEINPDKQSSKRIYRMLRDAFKKRAAHVAVMKEELKKCTTPYIVAGDFNDTPASYAVQQLTKDLNNAFAAQGQGLGRTYNGKFPNFQIDYILATKDFSVETYKITEARLSDHFPVRADLRFK